LRAAIQQVNALTGCGTVHINFAGVTGTIDAGNILPIINHNMNIKVQNYPTTQRYTDRALATQV
jgi:hypothetical protein